MNGTHFNIAFIATAILISLFLGIAGYFNPSAAEKAASTAVTAISIIFALSLALITVSCQTIQVNKNNIKDEIDRIDILNTIKSDNLRTIKRQRILFFISLLAVASGVLLIASHSISIVSIFTRILSSIFSFSASLSLLTSFLVPLSVARVTSRNQDLS